MLTYVVLCDMLDAERSGRQVEVFATEEELVEYTRVEQQPQRRRMTYLVLI
jgi:hypothetical protein